MSSKSTKSDECDDTINTKIKEIAKEEPLSQTSLKQVFDDLFEEIKCALCLEIYDRPLILTCLHTFCSSCLKELVEKNNTLTCPLCRHRIKLDFNGVKGLKTNYHLLNIVEKMRRASVKRCDECQVNNVREYCKQCKANLCPECGEKIHSLRLLRDHVRLPVSPEDCINTTNNSEEIDIIPSENHMEDDDLVVDFAVRRDACLDLFRKWETKLWFAPSDLKSAAVVRQLKALFLPYWLFEVETSSRYYGMSAVRLGTQSLSSWTPFANSNAGRHRFAVCATDCFEPEIVSKIEPWVLDDIQTSDVNTSNRNASGNGNGPETEIIQEPHRHCHPARSCSPITRTQAVSFIIDEQHAWNQGTASNAGRCNKSKPIQGECVEDKIRAIEKEQCDKKIKNDLGHAAVVKDLRVDTNFTRVAAQRIFLPVYILRYVYGGRSYIVLVNGQTGQLHGERPYSMGKMATISITGLAGLFGLLTTK